MQGWEEGGYHPVQGSERLFGEESVVVSST